MLYVSEFWDIFRNPGSGFMELLLTILQVF